MKLLFLLSIVAAPLCLYPITQQEANDMLHQGIRKNNPNMVKEAFQKGAEATQNYRYPESALERATQRLIRTVNNHDERPIHYVTRSAVVGFTAVTLADRVISSNKSHFTIGLPITIGVGLLIQKLLDNRATAAIQRSQNILSQVLEKTPKKIEYVYKIEKESNDSEKLKIAPRILPNALHKSMQTLDDIIDLVHVKKFKDELQKARAQVFHHTWHAITNKENEIKADHDLKSLLELIFNAIRARKTEIIANLF